MAKPQILDRRTMAKSRLFTIESLDLRFSNGEERCFERLRSSGFGAVMIIPLVDAETLLLIREYGAGVDDYTLGFPKGLIDEGETPRMAANRELQEEVGYAADSLTPLTEMSLAPGYFNARMQVFLARTLVASRLPGDEPEPIEVVPWSVRDLGALVARPDFHEARSIAALFLLQQQLAQEANT